MMANFPCRIFCLIALFVSALVQRCWADDKNAKCPLMTESDADPEFTVEFEGKKVLLCCDKCTERWHGNEKYIIKLAGDALPQFKGMESALGLEKVTLLPQKYCPIKTDNIVLPSSPSTEFKGVKVYFWDQKALEEWKKDPDKHAKRAIAAGLLPQLEGK